MPVKKSFYWEFEHCTDEINNIDLTNCKILRIYFFDPATVVTVDDVIKFGASVTPVVEFPVISSEETMSGTMKIQISGYTGNEYFYIAKGKVSKTIERNSLRAVDRG